MNLSAATDKIRNLACNAENLEQKSSLAVSCVWSDLVFWEGTKGLANWGDHPHIQVGRQRECTNYRGIPLLQQLLSLSGKVYAKCLEKKFREKLNQNWWVCSAVFVPGEVADTGWFGGGDTISICNEPNASKDHTA